jgi:hypothetical protein
MSDKEKYPKSLSIKINPKLINLDNLPTVNEIKKHRESIKPLGILIYIDYKHYHEQSR